MRSSSDDSVFWLVAATIAVGLGSFTWLLSKWLSVDTETAIKTLAGLMTLFLLIAASVWLSRDYPVFGIGTVWPVFLALGWACFWPALDFWSHPPDSKNVLAYSESLFRTLHTPKWWAEWYTKWGVFIGILAIGYFRGIGRLVGMR